MKKKDEIKKRNKKDEYQQQKQKYILETIKEIDEMVNKGVMDKYEAASLKDQILAT
ncbi:hypothetical protein KKF23_03250 [Patescibacteria group bacterium]|nr:hypothetical protein [Patescibacteria group bacterium]